MPFGTRQGRRFGGGAGLVLSLLLLALVACEGPAGPTGPQGPQGEQGPPGPQGPAGEDAQQFVLTGQLDELGAMQRTLPSEAGTIDDPPAITCFISDSANGPFVAVSYDSFYDPGTGTHYTMGCGIVQGGSGLAVELVGGPANWYYLVVAVKGN